MNKIIKRLHIPGYETKVFIIPRKNKLSKITNGIQLSLDIDMEPKKQVQET